MILQGSTLELRRVPLTLIYPGSLHNAIGLDNPTLAFFTATLQRGEDLSPVLLRTGPGIFPGLFRLEDGRKRWIAHLLIAKPDILAVVEERRSE